MSTLTEPTAMIERLAVILREKSIDPATVQADGIQLWDQYSESHLTFTVDLIISNRDRDFIRYKTSREVAADAV